MSYIIVWRNNLKQPFLDVDESEFLETYSTFESAKKEAEDIQKNEDIPQRTKWYFNYQIYKQVSL